MDRRSKHGTARGALQPAASPGLCLLGEQRWPIAWDLTLTRARVAESSPHLAPGLAGDQTARVIFEPELETLPTVPLRALQLERLRALVARVKNRVPLYQDRLADVEPGDIATLDDLRHLPFTRKDDLRDTYPFGMFAVPREEIIRIHASSGTTGKLTVVGYTAADVDLLARVNARSLAMAGAEPGMVLHNAYGYGLFTGGLGLHYGGERLGMAVVPVSGGMTARQLMLIADFRPDVIACTPSYALTLA